MLDRSPEFTFYQLPTRAWELLVGSLLSFREVSKPRAVAAQICGLSGCAAILISAFMLDETSTFPGPAALPSVVGAALVIYAGLGGASTVVERFLSTAPFRFVGLRSYSLYLWHWPKVPQTIAKNLLFGGDRPLAYSVEEYNKRNEDFFHALAANQSNICGRFELERALCASGRCAVENSAGPLYFDSNHPAAFQMPHFAALLSDNITQACRSTPEASPLSSGDAIR